MGDGAPFVHARCRGMLGGCLGGPARACGASARRHSQLHRWGMQRLHTRRGAAILQPFSAACSMDHAVVLHTRARRSRIARRGVERCEIVGQPSSRQTHYTRTSKRPRRGTATSLIKARARRHTCGRPAHPRNTLFVTAASTERLRVCSGTDARPHGNAQLRHAVSANDAGRAAPVTPS